MAARVFGGSMTENFNPLMYGSVRQVFTGLLRSLPDEDVTGLARAAQTARRLPRIARERARRSPPPARLPGCSPSRLALLQLSLTFSPT